MIDFNRIFVAQSHCIKNEEFLILDSVKAVICNKEITVVNSEMADDNSTLETAFPGKDVAKLAEDEIKSALSDKAEKYLGLRTYLASLRKLADTLPSFDSISKMDSADRVKLYLMAHTQYRAIIVPDGTLSDDDVESVKSLVKAWYSAQKGMSKFKDGLNRLLREVLGEEGDVFYGVATRKSDISETLFRHFMAEFSRTPARAKSGVENKKAVYHGDYEYSLKLDKGTVYRAFTNLAAVLLDSVKLTVALKETPEDETPEGGEKEE